MIGIHVLRNQCRHGCVWSVYRLQMHSALPKGKFGTSNSSSIGSGSSDGNDICNSSDIVVMAILKVLITDYLPRLILFLFDSYLSRLEVPCFYLMLARYRIIHGIEHLLCPLSVSKSKYSNIS